MWRAADGRTLSELTIAILSIQLAWFPLSTRSGRAYRVSLSDMMASGRSVWRLQSIVTAGLFRWENLDSAQQSEEVVEGLGKEAAGFSEQGPRDAREALSGV